MNHGLLVVPEHESQGDAKLLLTGLSRTACAPSSDALPQIIVPATADGGAGAGARAAQPLSGAAATAEWGLLFVPVVICVALVLYACLFLG